MILLDQARPGFAGGFEAIVAARREEASPVRDAVAEIIAAVRRDGDLALTRLTERLDRLRLAAHELRVDEAMFAAARAACPAAELEALRTAAERIRAFHARQLPGDDDHVDGLGVRLGLRWRPLDAVGLYVPGGTAAYPSSVLMNGIPAQVAGVGRIVMAVPMPDGRANPLVLAAAEAAGVGETYRIGGAQAVAALAYGTATIAPVDKIVGPGNAYVAEAKRQVFGQVGIDMIAGPSEVVIVADGGVDAGWLAADLLAQAEHDARAQSILITADAALARGVAAEVEAQLPALPRRDIAGASWRGHGVIILVQDLAQAAALVDRLAPEHLQLVGASAEALADRIRHAGAIFLGPFTPEVIGDYVGGPNHVLPTGRTSRFASGLAVHDFLKRTTLLACGREAFRALAPSAAVLARAEGLEGHARAIDRRLEA